jgi:hypothetical protein
MLAGNVPGEMVPPMVVYKALNIYSWCERGPKGALYSCSSGWFDSYQFEKWFFELMLPILKRKVGKKMLIGDNLSSHISAAVVEVCRQHDIQFVCLPPNSTDKLRSNHWMWGFSARSSPRGGQSFRPTRTRILTRLVCQKRTFLAC